MVKVRFKKDGKSLILTVKGHAGQAEAGHDLVCASASILAYTLAQVVTAMQAEGKLKKKPTIRTESGDFIVVCKPRTDSNREALQAFSVVQTGFFLLAHNYPQYVDLKKFDEA